MSKQDEDPPAKATAKRAAPRKKTARKRTNGEAGSRSAPQAKAKATPRTSSAAKPAKSARPQARTRAKKPSPPQEAPPAPQPADQASPAQLIRTSMPVRWRDLDAFNHVNNSKFLSYLEEARLQWMMTIAGDWIDENVAPVVAAAQINYRRPIQWPNEVAVELFVERLGRTSLTIGHRIVAARDAGVLFADGNVVMVWIDRHRGEAAELPESVRVACGGS